MKAEPLSSDKYKFGECPYCANPLAEDTVLLFYYCPNDTCPGDFALEPTTFTELEKKFNARKSEGNRNMNYNG